jgi:hypothetical protein
MKKSVEHENAVKELIAILDKHDCTMVETYACDDTLIISEDEDNAYALDFINVENDNLLIFSYSSPYESEEEEITSDEISTDILIEILEWVKDNEDELFGDWE